MNHQLSLFAFICFLMLTLNTSAQECPDNCKVSFPTTLTPNCDGVDCDVLEVTSNCTFIEFDFIIYNRWGSIIFQSDDPKEKFQGGDHEEGTYLWVLKGEFCNEESFDITGYIQIIR